MVGGGLAGLSAAIYLGRARRDTLVIDAGKSMARWEPDVQNYLGFPQGIGGDKLVQRGREQARRYEIEFADDEIKAAALQKGVFMLHGKRSYSSQRLLLATGIFHLPPQLDGVSQCLGKSLFFCKDCDGYRVQGKRIGIYGSNNETAEYALALLVYSSAVAILTDAHDPHWDKKHSGWLDEYQIPVYNQRILCINHNDGHIQSLCFTDGAELKLDALFTTRGDVYINDLAKALGAKVDAQGEVVVDADCATSVKGLYAAGCVTPANCQMIIAAGHGAVAAQAINRDLFCESLRTHSLRRFH